MTISDPKLRVRYKKRIPEEASVTPGIRFFVKHKQTKMTSSGSYSFMSLQEIFNYETLRIYKMPHDKLFYEGQN